MKRFYKLVSVGHEAAGYRVLLDGRAVKTVGGRPQAVPTAALAEAMAAEWAGQGEAIDPSAFLFRDMADYAIDVVAPERARAIMELLPYGETDTLCYRAEPDEPLAGRQREVWEPLLVAAEARHAVRFVRVAGIMHRPQPAETLEALRAELERLDAFALAALRNTTSLAASLTLGLAAIEPGADVAALWNAANLEEDWQAELWGKDAEAMERRHRRGAAFHAAARFAALARN
ncbi:ATP12 family chaperone protein [Novosphingobium cyanobacteriorum]|uniref:ATP12 family protein n=1 Tax=Novosphingobium cyanobacteriorum TaxID=3024215 RepID=A0ABT6CL67_9SPHN|nr:ATP12 family protein [Novosphingobium cyanobacteriorum]MDF8334531.1 ATP12 family protein [Novosphingobium cyanobacteriorum]